MLSDPSSGRRARAPRVPLTARVSSVRCGRGALSAACHAAKQRPLAQPGRGRWRPRLRSRLHARPRQATPGRAAGPGHPGLSSVSWSLLTFFTLTPFYLPQCHVNPFSLEHLKRHRYDLSLQAPFSFTPLSIYAHVMHTQKTWACNASFT